MRELASWIIAGALISGGLCWSGSASATEYPAACEPRTASPEDIEAAKGMHTAGKLYFKKGLYLDSIESWLSAYKFDCSAHRLLINIGNAHEMLGNDREAIKAFDTYIERAGKKADPAVVSKNERLKQRLSPVPTPIPPTPPPPPPKPPPKPTPVPGDGASGPGLPVGPIVLFAAGGASAIAGGVLLGIGLNDLLTADAACGEDRQSCPDKEAEAQGQRGRIMAPIGGAVMGIGLAAVGAGVVWLLLDDGDAAPAAKADARRRRTPPLVIRPQLSLGPHGGSAGVTVSF